MTVAQLSQTLTQEELVSWAAFFELKKNRKKKRCKNAKMSAERKQCLGGKIGEVSGAVSAGHQPRP